MQSAVPVRRSPAWCPGPQRWFDRTSRRANDCAPSSPAQRPATRMPPFHPSATIARIARVGRWHAALRPAGRRARGRGAGPGAGPAAAAAASASGPAWPGLPHRPAVARSMPGPAQGATGRPQGRARRWFLQRVVEGLGAWGPWRGIGSGGLFEATQHRRGSARSHHSAWLGGGCRAWRGFAVHERAQARAGPRQA